MLAVCKHCVVFVCAMYYDWPASIFTSPNRHDARKLHINDAFHTHTNTNRGGKSPLQSVAFYVKRKSLLENIFVDVLVSGK